MRPRRVAHRANGGFVLIAVLAIMAVLSAVVVALLVYVRGFVVEAAIASSDLRTDMLVQSAIALAAHQLFDLGTPGDQVDGQQIRLDAGVVTLRVASEGGRVDLNGSGRDLLAAAYRASGARSMTAETFAARVIDWRDGNDDPMRDGAEAPDYAAAGAAGPRNASFRSTEDLSYVLGVSPADVAALSDLVTVYNSQGRLDVHSASPELMASLPRMVPETLSAVMALRNKTDAATSAQLSDLLLVQASMIYADAPRTYRLNVLADIAGQAIPRRFEIVISPAAIEAAPYQTLYLAEL